VKARQTGELVDQSGRRKHRPERRVPGPEPLRQHRDIGERLWVVMGR
jgi:hypothetical protein